MAFEWCLVYLFVQRQNASLFHIHYFLSFVPVLCIMPCPRIPHFIWFSHFLILLSFTIVTIFMINALISDSIFDSHSMWHLVWWPVTFETSWFNVLVASLCVRIGLCTVFIMIDRVSVCLLKGAIFGNSLIWGGIRLHLFESR